MLRQGEVVVISVLEIISKLMGAVNRGELDDLLGHTYFTFMEESVNFEVSSNGESLRPLAEVCYKRLKALVDYDDKYNSCIGVK